ncbi:MAG: WecB/TagA/CpsF family glycosyltransferase [Polyangiaceae bacterium]|nr:WecB/TagA/CpsF family glycosyltransferase [Polyangiaceae bacterium]
MGGAVGELERVALMGVPIDPVDMTGAVDRVFDWAGKERGDECRFVVTPNVNHLVMLEHHVGLRDAYLHASLVVVDGAPLVWSAALLGVSLPGRVAGSDLVPGLFAAARDRGPITTYLLGAAPGVAETAAVKIRGRFPGVEVVGTYSPPMGFEHDPEENARILSRIDAARPDLLVVGLGAPKQEVWVDQHRHEIAAKVALCVGATIDFLAEVQPRAPVWMRSVGLEWAFRVAREPGRLTKRYLRDGWRFPGLLLRAMRGRRAP